MICKRISWFVQWRAAVSESKTNWKICILKSLRFSSLLNSKKTFERLHMKSDFKSLQVPSWTFLWHFSFLWNIFSKVTWRNFQDKLQDLSRVTAQTINSLQVEIINNSESFPGEEFLSSDFLVYFWSIGCLIQWNLLMEIPKILFYLHFIIETRRARLRNFNFNNSIFINCVCWFLGGFFIFFMEMWENLSCSMITLVSYRSLKRRRYTW